MPSESCLHTLHRQARGHYPIYECIHIVQGLQTYMQGLQAGESANGCRAKAHSARRRRAQAQYRLCRWFAPSCRPYTARRRGCCMFLCLPWPPCHLSPSPACDNVCVSTYVCIPVFDFTRVSVCVCVCWECESVCVCHFLWPPCCVSPNLHTTKCVYARVCAYRYVCVCARDGCSLMIMPRVCFGAFHGTRAACPPHLHTTMCVCM